MIMFCVRKFRNTFLFLPGSEESTTGLVPINTNAHHMSKPHYLSDLQINLIRLFCFDSC